ncbi:AAA domain-containing protein [uncultured Kordia sp.]|uniref:AAA domain-containing protein n=1 Tax=uncultured Kordia sp. TaxID=507699 RepID=UPI0026308E6C|nr:AAA domain-containing protein [uncultured Kordia sp.]
MQKINDYEIIDQITSYGENLKLWLTEDNSGSEFEIFTIQLKSEYKKTIDRIFKNEINPFINENIFGVQKVIETGFDKVNNKYYIVYENSQEDFFQIEDFNKRNFLNLVKTLNLLKSKNRYGFVLNDETVLVNNNDEVLIKYIGLFEIFKLYHALDEGFLSPEIIANQKPKIQDDIFAIATLYQEYLANKANIIPKSLAKERIDRYKKYSELIDDINEIKESLNISDTRNTIKIKSNVSDDDFEPIIKEMNEVCYWTIETEKSKQGQIMGQFSTENYSGRYYVDPQNYLFIPYINDRYEKTIKIGSIANFSFALDYTSFDCFEFFQDKYDEKNKLASQYKSHTNTLKEWQVLPKEEKKFIEEKAFKANYVERAETRNNQQNIRFTLTEGFIDWDEIRKLKKEKVVLYIDDSEIGTILDFDSSDQSLILKDTKVDLEEIPAKGKLIQDVTQEISQYKKQVEACKQFKERTIENPEIIGILTTPEKTPPFNRIDFNYDDFEKNLKSDKLKNDESQKEAVLEALHRKPVFLIQGPPGAGKTTVIVELVEQLVAKNSNCKILITSQSNLAVDNVLERLPKEILFMRLASNEVVDNDSIQQDVKAHLFENKLNHWIQQTQLKSEENFNHKIGVKSKNKAMIKFYSFYSRIQNGNEKEFLNEFFKKLRVSSGYIKKLFEHVKTKSAIENIFKKELGTTNLKLLQLQKEWFAFTSNATTEGKSVLNNGSTTIDLGTAYAMSMNVFGATCIHIASSKYRKINLKFDYVIMDEASKASPGETLVPISMGRNIILIGDHKQLPPVITREELIKDKVKKQLDDNGLDFEKTFGKSLFEKLISSFEQNPSLEPYIKMLDIQYRMPRHIGNIISNHFYDKKLKNPNVEIDILKDYDDDKSHGLDLKKPLVQITENDILIKVPNSVIFITTSNKDKPNDNGNKFDRKNYCNAKAIQETLEKLNELYDGNLDKNKPFNIGVIAGYRGQVNLLRNEIKCDKYSNFNSKKDEKVKSLIEINTVDKFQGSERDIIIYDIVRSDSNKSILGFLQDYRRINVALSRAKRLLIIVGDSEYILKRAMLYKDDRFNDFKLKNIIKELEEQRLIYNSLKEAVNG